MAKRVRDANLESRDARAKLKARGKPYFKSLDRGLHIGYRKGKKGGVWVCRRYRGAEKYAVESLGGADDKQDADGVVILDFYQAQNKARETAAVAREHERVAELGAPITVSDAIEAYFGIRERKEQKRGGRMKRDARSKLTKHVLDDNKLAATELNALTKDTLTKWRTSLSSKGLSGGSVRRIAVDFRAALNAAVKNNDSKLSASLPRIIRTALAPPEDEEEAVREAQVLADADIRRIIEAARQVDGKGDWGGDLDRLILVMAATGSRFSQLARVRVSDVQVAKSRISVPVSFKGKRRQGAPIHANVPVGEDVLAALRPAIAGRKGTDPLLLRPNWQRVGFNKHKKVGRGPWGDSAQLNKPWAAIIRATGLPSDLVPYCLRHSSIVRGLRAGLPINLVADLHNTSASMIERHYAAFIVDALDEIAARAVVPLTSPPPAPLRSVG